MAHAPSRPLSPHLGVWRWRVHMVVSILHRVTGHVMAFGATLILIWWLFAMLKGPETYGTFMACANSWIGTLVLVGITWSYFQHLLSGLRHLVMDTGTGYDIHVARRTAMATLFGSLLLTAALWAFVIYG
jgi:succinate dehydrogenase / fumarate reductase cytochrome b subunit